MLDTPADMEIVILEVDQSLESPGVVRPREARKAAHLAPSLPRSATSLAEVKRSFLPRVGEEVVLELSWFGIAAGEVTISTPTVVEVHGRKAYHVVGRAESNDLFSLIYRVDDRIESLFDAETLLPYRFSIRADETFRQQKRVVLFHRADGKIDFWEKEFRRGKFEHEKRNCEKIPGKVFDPVSALYYLRSTPLEVGKTYSVAVFDNDATLWRFTVTVLRTELLKTRVGTFSTLVLEPKTWRGEELKNKGKLLAWLTNDEKRLLVRVESETKFGAIVADVKSIR